MSSLVEEITTESQQLLDCAKTLMRLESDGLVAGVEGRRPV
jgi:hypothetical protein